MDAAQVSIRQERQQAEQQLRNEGSAFALQIASKVVKQQLADDKAQTRLVVNLIDQMD